MKAGFERQASSGTNKAELAIAQSLVLVSFNMPELTDGLAGKFLSVCLQRTLCSLSTNCLQLLPRTTFLSVTFFPSLSILSTLSTLCERAALNRLP